MFWFGGPVTVRAPEDAVNVKPTIRWSISKACVSEPGLTSTTELTSGRLVFGAFGVVT
jgi:hypothetical protein